MKDRRPVFSDIGFRPEMPTSKNINEMKLRVTVRTSSLYEWAKAPDGDLTKLLDRLDRLQEKLEIQERTGDNGSPS